jgi:hypothetical protein
MFTTNLVPFEKLSNFQQFSKDEKKKKTSAQHHQYWLTPSISRIGVRRFIFPGAQIRHFFAQLHDSPNWPTQRQWCAQTVSVLLMFLIFPQSGYNSRVKAFHIVNASPWTETVLSMMKFVLKNKIAGRVSVIQYTEFSNLTFPYFHI